LCAGFVDVGGGGFEDGAEADVEGIAAEMHELVFEDVEEDEDAV
jgi:hypothetical protein